MFSVSDATYITLKIDQTGNMYVGYLDNGATGGAMVKKCAQGGASWNTVGIGPASAGAAYYVAFDLDSNGVPYVAFADNTQGLKATVMKYDSAGNTWNVVGNAGFSAGTATYLSFSIDGTTPYLTFTDSSYSNLEVMKYDSIGNSWTVLSNAPLTTGLSGDMSLYTKNGNIFIGYGFSAKNYIKEYNSSTDSWDDISPPILSSDLNVQVTGDASGNIYNLCDQPGYTGIILQKRTSNTWSQIGTTIADNDFNLCRQVDFDGNTIYVTYVDSSCGASACNSIMLLKYDSSKNIWNSLVSSNITNWSKYLSMAIYNSTVYIAYEDFTSGNGKIIKYVP